jgi:hypothetical protein
MPDEEGQPVPEDVDFAEALSPFSREEQARLVRYTVRAERLANCSFFERREQRLSANYSVDEGLTVAMTHAPVKEEDEAIDAMFQRLRIFYAPGRARSTSFSRTMTLLRAHAEASPGDESAKLIGLLDAIKQTEERAATSGPGIGMVIETRLQDGSKSSRNVEPREAFEDWMYGEHLHDDEERLARIEPFRDHGVHRYVALAVATDLAHVYIWVSRWLLIPHVLAQATLFPPPLAVQVDA